MNAPMKKTSLCFFFLFTLFLAQEVFSKDGVAIKSAQAYQRVEVSKPTAPPALLAEGSKIVDDFESYRVNHFPSSWRTWPFQRSKATKVYRVKKEGMNQFLNATDNEDISVQILFNFPWDVAEYPTLSWRWRPSVIPTGAHEDNGNTNDSACGVYVTVGQMSGNALKYVWSSTLPKGKVVVRKEGRLKIIVMGTGTSGLRSWHSVKVNVLEDYKKHFGSKPDKNPRIALLTDGNAVHKPASCDYDDFLLKK
ncbi:MAG: hypothetical protein COX62_07840 [Deltaproteobacteria bacterium CG_4_10_14_0_2_um_filter_43_8]|nr:MAG: hypothetical protein COV43_08950 [Deltaproteobacteria bacterium CG11_big_fil_rev_8_21_14_0_20_42_23]PJA18876.1 MAG: hypothetical protein COX62_07840 [Deltaproteobacteria bacterium CG_4_10_14_0_2_um_filter_43_8]PJC64709.1 MAG: hypothetical protein CO021_02845 [Deltaproteobacteria bacterium CG_4_9_14_0_2_um_filter_42_21]